MRKDKGWYQKRYKNNSQFKKDERIHSWYKKGAINSRGRSSGMRRGKGLLKVKERGKD